MKRDERRNDGIRHAFFMCAILEYVGHTVEAFYKGVCFYESEELRRKVLAFCKDACFDRLFVYGDVICRDVAFHKNDQNMAGLHFIITFCFVRSFCKKKSTWFMHFINPMDLWNAWWVTPAFHMFFANIFQQAVAQCPSVLFRNFWEWKLCTSCDKYHVILTYFSESYLSISTDSSDFQPTVGKTYQAFESAQFGKKTQFTVDTFASIKMWMKKINMFISQKSWTGRKMNHNYIEWWMKQYYRIAVLKIFGGFNICDFVDFNFNHIM